MWQSTNCELQERKVYWVRSVNHNQVGRAKCIDGILNARGFQANEVWIHDTNTHPSTITSLESLEGALGSLNEDERQEYLYFASRWVRELKLKGLSEEFLNDSRNDLYDRHSVSSEIFELLDTVDASVFSGDGFIQMRGNKPNRDFITKKIKIFIKQITNEKKGA